MQRGEVVEVVVEGGEGEEEVRVYAAARNFHFLFAVTAKKLGWSPLHTPPASPAHQHTSTPAIASSSITFALSVLAFPLIPTSLRQKLCIFARLGGSYNKIFRSWGTAKIFRIRRWLGSKKISLEKRTLFSAVSPLEQVHKRPAMTEV